MVSVWFALAVCIHTIYYGYLKILRKLIKKIHFKHVTAEIDIAAGGKFGELISKCAGLINGQSANGAYCIELAKSSILNPSDKEKDSCMSISYCNIEKVQIDLSKFCERMPIPKFFCKPLSDIKVGKCQLRGWMIAIIVLIVLAVVGIGICIIWHTYMIYVCWNL